MCARARMCVPVPVSLPVPVPVCARCWLCRGSSGGGCKVRQVLHRQPAPIQHTRPPPPHPDRRRQSPAPSHSRATYPRRRPAPLSPPSSPRARAPRRRVESQAGRFISPPSPRRTGRGPPDSDTATPGAPPARAIKSGAAGRDRPCRGAQDPIPPHPAAAAASPAPTPPPLSQPRMFAPNAPSAAPPPSRSRPGPSSSPAPAAAAPSRLLRPPAPCPSSFRLAPAACSLPHPTTGPERPVL